MSGAPPNGPDEFPSLTAAGLYAAETSGNGNCLFHALSEQLYGNQNQHGQLRSAVIDHMKEHADQYKPFLAAGGGSHRKPKRKNVGALQAAPTPGEINAHFQRHLDEMARGGTYGDNMEVQAFANAFGVDVKIWHHNGQAWLLQSSANSQHRRVVHIAYHDYEHFSSVRNAKGPHNGMPNVQETNVAPPSDAYSGPASPGGTILLQPWKAQAVKSSLPFFASNDTVHRALDRFRGDVGDAVTYLIERDERSSVPSTPGSESIERDGDDDDDGENADRAKRSTKSRLGVDTRGAKKTLARKVQAAERVRHHESSSPSPSGSQSSVAPSPSPQGNGVSTPPEDSDNTEASKEASRLTKPKPAKHSASATKAAKKRAQKEAAKERKQQQAASKGGVGGGKAKGQAKVPTTTFQTLEI